MAGSASRSVARWYKTVDVKTVQSSKYAVTLDQKPILTPKRASLDLPNPHLAWAIAIEWEAQQKIVAPHTMPLTKLATISTDQVKDIRQSMVDSMIRAMHTDVACMRCGKDDPALNEKETKVFDPLLQWANDKLGLKLLATDQLMIDQPREATQRASHILASVDDWELAALDQVAGTSKSLVLALAVLMRRISAEEACYAARLAEIHQADLWGEVEAGHDLDAADVAVRISSAATFLRLLAWDKETSIHGL